MDDLNRIVATGPTTTAIEYSVFISVVANVAIAAFDGAGGLVNHVFTIATDALTAAISA